MRKKLLSGFALVAGLNFLIKPIYLFGIDAEIQNILGAETYGEYFALLNLSILFNIFLDFGLTNYNTTTIAKTPVLLPKYFSSILVTKLSLLLLYSFLMLSCVYIFQLTQNYTLVFLLIGSQFCISFLQYLRSNFTALLQFKLDALFSILDRTLLVICCVILIVFYRSQLSIYWFVGAQLLSYLVATLLALCLQIRKIPFHRINKLIVFSIAKSTLPYALLIFSMSIYTRIDAIMLSKLDHVSSVSVGIYAQAFRWLDATTMISLILANLMLPLFSKLLNQKEELNKLIEVCFSVLVSINLFIALFAYQHSFEIIQLRYTSHQEVSAKVFQILILSALPQSITYIFGSLLTANNNMKFLNKMALIGIVVNVVLNYILIPHYSALGAAVATVITQSITALIQFYLACKIMLKKEVNFLFYGKYIAFTLVFILTSSIIRVENMVLEGILHFISFMILFFIFRIISWNNIINRLKKR